MTTAKTPETQPPTTSTLQRSAQRKLLTLINGALDRAIALQQSGCASDLWALQNEVIPQMGVFVEALGAVRPETRP